MGGRLARWELYHDLHRVEHAARRGPCSRALGAASADPAHPGWHVLNGHLPWLLPPLLQLMRCLNAVWEPQVGSRDLGAYLAPGAQGPAELPVNFAAQSRCEALGVGMCLRAWLLQLLLP